MPGDWYGSLFVWYRVKEKSDPPVGDMGEECPESGYPMLRCRGSSRSYARGPRFWGRYGDGPLGSGGRCCTAFMVLRLLISSGPPSVALSFAGILRPDSRSVCRGRQHGLESNLPVGRGQFRIVSGDCAKVSAVHNREYHARRARSGWRWSQQGGTGADARRSG
jgi:hypothetical protein